MNRYLLVVGCLVCSLAAAGPAGAISIELDENYLIGTVVNASPSDLASELVYAQNLINLYNAGTTGTIVIGTETYNVWGGSIGDYGVLTEVTGGFQLNGGETPPDFPLDVSGGSYLWAKFGGYGALYWLDSIDFVTGIDTSLTKPAGVGGGLSHVTSIPEPGTLILLGSSLLGLALVRGRKKFRK